MSKTALVIVESPTKAKTIRKFLPKEFVVEASMGHVRDLPESASDIPEAVKKEKWARIGVNYEQNFEPLYVIPKGKSKIVAELRRKLKDADVLYLATDEDREGESISWHLHELLKPKVPVKRMVFHEITKGAITRALEDCREIDQRLVKAQETRRVLDRLVGYTISPLLWSKITYGLSAGRVQSVGLRLIVDRERERMSFQRSTYWDLFAKLNKGASPFGARLVGVDGKRIASGRDFDETTGKLLKPDAVRLLDEAGAQSLLKEIKPLAWKVTRVEEKPLTSRPSPPFITSTLQQEANRKLGWSSRDAMRVAQRLYEEGWITYMRTDSPSLSQEAIGAARSCVEALYGKEYLSPEPRQYSAKNKGAQEAHEAIRPAGGHFQTPKETGLSGRELALYELIWKRTVATQMAEARKKSLQVGLQAGRAEFTSSGTSIVFPGFIRAYVEGSDDPEAELDEKESLLPALVVGETVTLQELNALGHETKPPARFTDAALIQKLEKEGVGRPSTYATIIDTLIDRTYVRRVGNALIPSFTGMAVTQLLEKYFASQVDLQFTSKMEESLDQIAEGTLEALPYLKKFYLGAEGLSERVKTQDKVIKAEESRSIELTHLKDYPIKIGRYGPYIVLGEVHASIPEDFAPADLTEDTLKDLLETQKNGPQSLGVHPTTGESVYCLTGRFGPYVQLGQATESQPKPKRVSLIKGMEPKTLTLEQALALLSLPRNLGEHPTSHKPVTVSLGRFGPYVAHDGEFRSLRKEDDVFTVQLPRALELLAQEKRARRGAQALRELGAHPVDGKPLSIFDGKYGMYIKHEKTNATLPKDWDPEKVTIEQALILLKDAEEKRGGGAKKTKRVPKVAKKKTKKAS